MSCKFDYKKDKSEGRVFFEKRRDEDNPSTDLDDKRVYKALLKVRRKANSPVMYSRSVGKQLPSALDIRLLKASENYWKYTAPEPSVIRQLRAKRKIFR